MNIYQQVEVRLKKYFGENVQFELIDERSDGRHFLLSIISDDFISKTRLERSRIVFAVLDDLFKNDVIHALRMKLKTVEESKSTY